MSSNEDDQTKWDRWRRDPANWRNGFYCNKEDKRLFPPKRNKYFGWTINFAYPPSILANCLLIAFVVVMITWVFHLKRLVIWPN